MTGVRRSATVLLVLAGTLAAGGSADADEQVVRIGRDGVRPQVLGVTPGDTVRFVNDDPTFAYRAQSTGGPWRFDSGPTVLLQGDFVVPSALTRAGTYTYRVAQDAPFTGSVVVAGAAPPSPGPASPGPASPAPAPPPPVAPTSAPTSAPTVAPAVPGPLAGSRSHRALGLAVAVAVVLLAGAASLLLRLLLALPVLPDPAAGLDARGARPPRW